MVSSLFFYQLILFALIGLVVIVHLTRPKRLVAAPATPTKEPEPLKPKRHRTSEPQPFEGLTHKPHCVLCERDTTSPKAPLPVPPDPMPPTNRRPHEVDTSLHFCPHGECDYRGWLGLGNLRANGHPSGGPWRQFHCTSCNGYFWKRMAPSSTANKQRSNSSCGSWPAWLRAWVSAPPLGSSKLLPTRCCSGWSKRPSTCGPFPRIFSVISTWSSSNSTSCTRCCETSKPVRSATTRPSSVWSAHHTWVWTAMDPRSKLLVVVDVGTRTLAMAQRVVHQVTRVLAPGCVPLFLTDGLKDYATALLAHFGQWIQAERRQHKGPRPQPRWMPLSELLYAQVVKSYQRRRLVGVKHRVVFGTQLAIEQVLAACGWTINTAFIERLNLDIRQRVAAVGRRVNTLCRGEEGLLNQMVLFQTYHNFVLLHASLRQPLPIAEATNGGSAKVWPWTPAMAAGLTDHVWSLKEVLLYRVPPWQQAQTR